MSLGPAGTVAPEWAPVGSRGPPPVPLVPPLVPPLVLPQVPPLVPPRLPPLVPLANP